MSRATAIQVDDKPSAELERVSTHPNWVTQRGALQLADTVRELENAREQATLADDAASVAHINRDLGYWRQRLRSARVVTPGDALRVRFGVTVELQFGTGMRWRYTLVGEDEADPTSGLISWLSPVAQTLLGHEAGEVIKLPSGEALIVSLTLPPQLNS